MKVEFRPAEIIELKNEHVKYLQVYKNPFIGEEEMKAISPEDKWEIVEWVIKHLYMDRESKEAREYYADNLSYLLRFDVKMNQWGYAEGGFEVDD